MGMIKLSKCRESARKIVCGLVIASSVLLFNPLTADAAEYWYSWGPYKYYYVDKNECQQIADQYEAISNCTAINEGVLGFGAAACYKVPVISALLASAGAGMIIGNGINGFTASEFRKGAERNGATVTTLHVATNKYGDSQTIMIAVDAFK